MEPPFWVSATSAPREEMNVAAALNFANLISDEELCEDYIIPKAFDPRVGAAVANHLRAGNNDITEHHNEQL